MPTFRYIANSESGPQCEGELHATSRADALAQLQQMVLTPISLSESTPRRVLGKRVSRTQLVNLYMSLADLLESGMPLLKSLDLMGKATPNNYLATAVKDVKERVEGGSSLADAMQAQHGVFDELCISLVRVGEEGGFLEESFSRLATLTRRHDELRNKVINALTYPAFLLIIGLCVTGGMFLYFVPVFEPLFDRMRQRGELPWTTNILLGASDTARSMWLPILAVTVALAFAMRSWSTTPAGRICIDRWKLTSAGVGPLCRDLILSRFANVLGTLLKAGVPMLRAIDLAEKSLGNSFLAATLADAKETLSRGGTLAQTLDKCEAIPTELTQQVAIAEQSNRLDNVLLGAAERMEQRSERQLERLTKLLEPMLMTLLAGAIGFLITALLMPIFSSAGRF